MNEREDFLVKLCICLFLCLIGLAVVLFCNGCSSSASVVIKGEVFNG